jgi:MFS family permease
LQRMFAWSHTGYHELNTCFRGVGPPLGGILASAGAWRWLFYLNLPIFGVAAALQLCFLHNTPPESTVSNKLRRMDWLYVFELPILCSISEPRMQRKYHCCWRLDIVYTGSFVGWHSVRMVRPSNSGTSGDRYYRAFRIPPVREIYSQRAYCQ